MNNTPNNPNRRPNNPGAPNRPNTPKAPNTPPVQVGRPTPPSQNIRPNQPTGQAPRRPIQPGSTNIPQMPNNRNERPSGNVAAKKSNTGLILGICGGVGGLLLIGIIIAIIMFATSGGGSSSSTALSNEPGDVTRGEWINMLAESYGMDDYVSSDPYFSDVSSSSEYFTAVQACTEWDVLEAGGNFNPDKIATNEFAIITGVKAIGLDLIQATEEGANVSDDASIVKYFSANSGVLYSDGDLNSENAEMFLNAFSDMAGSLNMVQSVDYVFTEDVIEAQAGDVQFSGSTATVSGTTVNAGDIVYIAPCAEYPSGISVKATSSGSSFEFEEASIEETFSDIDIIGTFAPEFFEAPDGEDWGYEIIDNPDEMSFDEDKEVYVQELGSPTDYSVNKTAGGSVQLKDVWLNVLPPKNIMDVEVTGKICLKKPTINVQFNGTPGNIKRISVSLKTTISAQIEASVSEEVDLPSITVPFRVCGIIGGDIVLSPKIGMDGSFTITYSCDFSTGYSYKQGAKPKLTKSIKNGNATQDFQVSGYVKAKLKIALSIIGVDVADIGTDVGGYIDAETTPTNCIDLDIYLKLSVFINSDDSLLGKIGIGKEWTIFDKDNSPLKKNVHIEDGKIVPKCTRNGSSNNSGESTTSATTTSSLVKKLQSDKWHYLPCSPGDMYVDYVFRSDFTGDMVDYDIDENPNVYNTFTYYESGGCVVVESDLEYTHRIYEGNSDNVLLVEWENEYGESGIDLLIRNTNTFSSTNLPEKLNNKRFVSSDFSIPDIDLLGFYGYDENEENPNLECYFEAGDGSDDTSFVVLSDSCAVTFIYNGGLAGNMIVIEDIGKTNEFNIYILDCNASKNSSTNLNSYQGVMTEE